MSSGEGMRPRRRRKPIAVVDDVEDAHGVCLAGALDLALQDALDEIVLAHLGGVVDLQLGTDLDQLVEVLGLEFVDVHAEIGPTY